MSHRVGDPESKRLKVAALNLFHPTASPLFQKAVFSYCETASTGRGILSYSNPFDGRKFYFPSPPSMRGSVKKSIGSFSRHSGPDFHRDKFQPGDRREAE
jgi:hypothetical protein